METGVTQTETTGADAANTVSAERKAFFDILLSRQSYWPLTDPGPGDAELDLIFDAALRAPDHGRLRPWRVAFVRNDARAELAEILIDIAAARELGTPRSAHEHRREKAYAAPVIIALGVSVVTGGPIPENEQLLSAGAATMNMLNAIHALGYGGFWATGIDTYDAALLAALDFEPSDRLIGFLFVGTPKSQERSALRPPRANHVREWLGRSSV
ncbi:nitroreductase family protein [Caballeronia sordidicola]|uniref:Putative NAD(P)H nitroreductase n=1 Tax=Caballeronia sordidicola TaxID=196367 RepID=A0A158HLV9_CABSO|nr:nitroreductase [Caballeronia sordidicola]SAL45053.1 nitroreductase family protein [Caballeronia sordidicola]